MLARCSTALMVCGALVLSAMFFGSVDCALARGGRDPFGRFIFGAFLVLGAAFWTLYAVVSIIEKISNWFWKRRLARALRAQTEQEAHDYLVEFMGYDPTKR